MTLKTSRPRAFAECIPCLVNSRHSWCQRANIAERKWRELKDLIDPPGERKNAVPPRGYLSLFHIETAMKWPDGMNALVWAMSQNATVTEMKAWHRAEHGQDLNGGD